MIGAFPNILRRYIMRRNGVCRGLMLKKKRKTGFAELCYRARTTELGNESTWHSFEVVGGARGSYVSRAANTRALRLLNYVETTGRRAPRTSRYRDYGYCRLHFCIPEQPACKNTSHESLSAAENLQTRISLFCCGGIVR